MVREFYIENEKGQLFSMMDMEEGCFFNLPTGLGYAYESEYKKVGNTFITNIREMTQGSIGGEGIFKDYESYRNFINFIETSNKLKFKYRIPYGENHKEFFKDIEIESIDKTEIDKDSGFLICPIIFNCLSMWYEEIETIYTIEPNTEELRWNFRFPSRFISYDNRSISYENKGHEEASFKLEINGYVKDPVISVYANGILINQLDLTGLTLAIGDTLYYSTKSNELYLYKISNNVKTNLFNSLSLSNKNFFKLPKGVSEIRLSADDDITSAKLIIFTEYKSV